MNAIPLDVLSFFQAWLSDGMLVKFYDNDMNPCSNSLSRMHRQRRPVPNDDPWRGLLPRAQPGREAALFQSRISAGHGVPALFYEKFRSADDPVGGPARVTTTGDQHEF